MKYWAKRQRNGKQNNTVEDLKNYTDIKTMTVDGNSDSEIRMCIGIYNEEFQKLSRVLR